MFLFLLEFYSFTSWQEIINIKYKLPIYMILILVFIVSRLFDYLNVWSHNKRLLPNQFY